MEKVNVVFSPFHLDENKYVQIMKSLISKKFNVISIKGALKNFSILKSVKIVHLNWYEALPVSGNMINVVLDFVKKTLFLITFKFFGAKIIWTYHNKMQHESNFLILQKMMISLVLKNSHIILIHSKISKNILLKSFPKIKELEKKVVYLPHPDYINDYGSVINSNNQTDTRLNLLFLGMIRPYKNLEILLDAVKSFNYDEVSLKIAGNYTSREYLDNLLNKYGTLKNVTFDVRFIPDNEMSKIIQSCDLLVLPYDITSSLNSGTVIMAFSYKKTVIVPEIGTVLDYGGSDDILSYSYKSTNGDQHLEVLKKQIRKALDLKASSNNVFLEKGENVFDMLVRYNSKELIANKIQNLYTSLLG